MKGLIIIAVCFAVALALRFIDVMTSGKINSVGAKSNKESRKMPTLNINDPEELKEALKQYKGMED